VPGKPKGRKPASYQTERRPVARVLPARQGDEIRPAFSFEFIDRASAHDFNFDISEADSKIIMDFFRDIGNQSWREIRAQTTSNNRRTFPKHHAQSTDDVCKDAKDRLAAIGLNEITDALFRFRLGGKRRLWGFIADGVFHAVWWDPEHQVYPTEPNS
jgi:hypothetical protein